MKRSILCLIVCAASVVLCCGAAQAREWKPAGERTCSAEHFHVNDLIGFAESREQRLANGSTNFIDPGQNGSIHVHGWNNADVLVTACIHTAASTDAAARALASQVTIAQGAGMIKPSGPSTNEQSYWNVSYDVWVPSASNLDLKASNGSIAVETVRGQIHFQTLNGSVHLNEVGGDVEGSTTNGSLLIDVAGSGWSGNGLRAQTTNGSVRLNLPENFSAQVQASTVNGRIKVDFPITLSGEVGKTMSFQLGGGGPLIEAKTVNGSVHISRKA